ncbi:flagellar biosynthesis protein FliZ [Bacillus sp. T33-2]|nr:flagellar biosynthesis protein FliZ [Bacillus sp. T33-2]
MASMLLIMIAALAGPQSWAGAEQLNKSVKDYYENPKANSDSKADSETKQDTEKGQESAKVGVTAWDFIKMILATAFVAGLLYFLLRFINKKSISYKSSQLVENLGGTSLGGNRSVQVIKAGSRLLVVGVGENIQLLTEIDDPDEYRQVLEDYNSKMEQLVQPSDIVTKILRRTNIKSSGAEDSKPFGAMLKTQLDEIATGRKQLFEELEKKGPHHNE